MGWKYPCGRLVVWLIQMDLDSLKHLDQAPDSRACNLFRLHQREVFQAHMVDPLPQHHDVIIGE